MLGYYLVLDYGFEKCELDEGVYRRGLVIVERATYSTWNIRTPNGWMRDLLEYEVANIVESLSRHDDYCI